MQDSIRRALEVDTLIDITTTGAKTCNQSRIEIGFPQRIEGELYLMGSPGKRAWLANLIANPQFTLHLKQSTTADIQATATPILNKVEKRRVYQLIMAQPGWEKRIPELDIWVEQSPLARVDLPKV